mgnify:CR=1 FL=1
MRSRHKARTSMPRGAISTMATSTPSADVPDIRPATPDIHSGIIAGKLNGVMPATTPSGCRNE